MDQVSVSIPDAATDAEAAAIVAAVEAHLAAERAAQDAAESGTDSETWTGNRWTFAGRLERLRAGPTRVPRGAPTDPWTAAGRRDRF